ncbi:unnamed protein product [Lactuca virosa]|uniref:Uncharacterized protein n=1 Tax=Lactuca virosa TaxID=75947 RepID=A0AAU9PP44_9ASTR|nr:unnamed protein product [Lactuca virosa]
MALPVSMISSYCVVPTSEYAETLRERYDFQPEDKILVPLDGASFLEPPPGKFDIYVKTFDSCYRLPTCDFLDEEVRFQGKNLLSNNIFIPKWNLTDESLLSQQEVAGEFSRHVFPKRTITEMEAFTEDLRIDFMEFPYAQNDFFLTAGARRIRHLKSVAAKLSASERGLQQHNVSMESSVESSRQQLELLAGDKMTLQEHCAQVDSKLDDNLQKNETLNIRVESLEIELLDREKLLHNHEAKLSRLGRCIKDMCFSAGEESDREALHKEVVAKMFDPSAISSTSSHSREMVDATDSFIYCDYASMMKLGSLDIIGLRQLCVDGDHAGVDPNNNAKITGLDGGAGK